MSEDRTEEFLSLCQSIASSEDGSGSNDGIPKPSLHSLPTTVHDNLTRTHPAGFSGRGGKSGQGSSLAAADGGSVAGPYGGRYGASSSSSSSSSSPSRRSNDDPSDELRRFHSTASDISRDIAATSALLSELAQLVRRRTLFAHDDHAGRVNWLVHRIRSNVEGLNTRLEEAGSVIARSKRRLGKDSQAGKEASNLVGQLREEFARTTAGFKKVLQQRSENLRSAADRRRDVVGGASGSVGGGAAEGEGAGGGDSLVLQNKPMVYGSSSSNNSSGLGGGVNGGFGAMHGSFLDAPNGSLIKGGAGGMGGLQPLGGPRLDLTSAYLAASAAARRGGEASLGDKDGGGGIPAGESTSSGINLPRPHGAAAGDPFGSSLTMGMRHRHNSLERSYSEPPDIHDYSLGSGGGGISGAPLTPLDIQRMEEETGQSQMMQLIPDQSYLQERADAMSQVESNIVELGTIFNKLAVMVSEHRELVQRVEDNVDDANETINLSLARLTDTLDNLRSNRALAMKVFAVIVVFVILFVTFFA